MPRNAFFIIAILTLPLIVGCEGCRTANSNGQAEDEQDKVPLEAFSTEPAAVYPTDQNAVLGSVKPGHWTTAEQSIRSNQADARGELTSNVSVVRRDINLDSVGEIRSLNSLRPVVLPKGQMRGFDFRFRCPVPNSIDTRRVFVNSRLVPRSGGVMDTGAMQFNVMRGSEYFFVVLTTRPEQFTRLQVADWARSSEIRLDDPQTDSNYRIVVPDAGDLLPLPETMLDMTSTAVVLWDDLSEDALTPLQQYALADWIRFGGRLIVNGPAASDAVANTMLADLLPLLPTSNIELDGQAAVDLLTENSVATDRTLPKQIENVRSENSRIAIDGQLDPQASAIPGTASLVLRRRFGRGCVIQPRFDLTDNWIESWDSYDSFFNSVVLNRPRRRYVPPNYGGQDIDAQDVTGAELSLFFEGTKIRSDAAVNTQFRIATRDSLLGEGGEDTLKVNTPFDSYSKVDAITGVSAWNDNSDAIKLMRETLTSEAGIEIPGSGLVVRSLALYLIVLVPLNYIVFRLMNRLEYAWFAVPIIAVVGAVWAARQARLDIGFARSNTELAILEAHADYPRAHLTRVIGVYNSLSSRYEMQFPTADGMAAPLQDEPDPGTTEQPILKLSFEEGASLANFAVSSNRMRFVHTEEMVDLGGSFEFDGQQSLTNQTRYELFDCSLVRKTEQGDLQVALVGALASMETVTVEFADAYQLNVGSELPMQTDRLIRRFSAGNQIPVGSTRLIARIDDSIDGLQVTPSASQHLAQTVVLVHLQHAEPADPSPDINLVSDFRRVNRLDSTDQTDGDGGNNGAAVDAAENEKETADAENPIGTK